MDVVGKVGLLCYVYVYREGICCLIDLYCSQLKEIQKKKYFKCNFD